MAITPFTKIVSNTPNKVIHGLFFGLLLVLIAGVTITYVNNERAFYFWDYKGYQDRSEELATYFRTLQNPSLDDFSSLIEAVRQSTFNDYSYYPALLPALAAATLGSNRLTYVLSLMLLHTLPFALVVGAITAKLIPSRPMLVFWSGAFIAALLPSFWRPTLRGYPDIAAALLVAAALMFYIKDLERKRWWHIIVVGLILALAMLFRRHFLYAVASFFMAAACEPLTLLAGQRKPGQFRLLLTRILAQWVRISLILCSMMIGIVVFGPYFVGRLLNENFGTLYASYIFSIPQTIESLTSQYGWLIILGSAAGFAGGIFTGYFKRPAGIFFSLYSLIMILIWVLVVRQVGEHYSLHFAATVSVGLMALGWLAFTKRAWIILILSSVFMIANFYLALDPLRQVGMSELGSNALLSAYSPPLVDSNYEKIMQLVIHLRRQSPEAVFVAASSLHINQSILRSADEVARAESDAPLPILFSADIDSRDWYPLEQLLDADWVIVGLPFQHTLVESEQDVVGVVVNAFAENWPITQDFQLLPETFDLDNGATLQLFQRIRPTSVRTALQTYQVMADFIGERPLSQGDWMNLTPSTAYEANKIAENQYSISLAHNSLGDNQPAVLLYLNPLSGSIHLSATLHMNEGCDKGSLKIEAISDLEDQQQIEATATQVITNSSFEIDLVTNKPSYLLLSLVDSACNLDITDLIFSIDAG